MILYTIGPTSSTKIKEGDLSLATGEQSLIKEIFFKSKVKWDKSWNKKENCNPHWKMCNKTGKENCEKNFFSSCLNTTKTEKNLT